MPINDIKIENNIKCIKCKVFHYVLIIFKISAR